MNTKVVERLTWFIFGLGLCATAGAYALFGRVAAQSTLAGAALALGNWTLLRFILQRIIRGTIRSKAAFSGLLVVKMGVLMALVFVVLRSGLFEPIAFTVGVSCLVVGALLGSLISVMTASPEAPEGSAS